MVSQNPLLQSAALYARTGFRVFPCKSFSKEPLQGLKWTDQATTDAAQIWRWWLEFPQSNIGVVADRCLILDIDRKPGKADGCETLKDYFPLPVTPTVATPNGGWHFYFSTPDGWQPKVRHGPGFDVQVGNAYVLAPPSWLGPSWAGLEPYGWVRNYWVGTVPLAPLPAGLVTFLGQAAARVAEVGTEVPPPPLITGAELEAIWPDVSGWPARLRSWWDDGRVDEYDTQSEVIHALARQLYQHSLTPQQVLSVMWEHGWTQSVALEHRRGQTDKAVAWLWLSCIKLEESRRPAAAEVFEAQAGEDTEATYKRLYDRVKALQSPNTPETLKELAGVLAEGQRLPEVARALLATLVGDAGLGMTRKQAEAVLSPSKGRRKPAGSGQSGDNALSQLGEHIWVGPADRFYNVRTCDYLTKHALTQQYAHLASEQQPKEEVIEELLRREGAKVEGITFRPDLPRGRVQEDGRLKWNNYQGLALEPAQGDWGPYLDLFDRMGVDPADRDHVLDYLAHMIQVPEKRIRHALVIGGKGHGTGKDTLFEPLKQALGERHVHELKGRNLYSRFNGYMLRSRLVLVQEAHQENVAQAKMLEQQLKPMITSDWVEVEEKGINAVMARNFVHWVITTNEVHPLHISAGDRRYAMVRVRLEYDSEAQRVSWDPYWTWIHQWFKSGGARWVLWELMHRDIRRFNPNAAPGHTVWHQEVVEMGLSEEETLVRDALEEGAGVLGWDFFTLDHAWASVKTLHPHQLDKNGRPVSRWAVQQALKKFDYTDYRLRFMVDGVRQQFKVWTNNPDTLKSRNPEAHWRTYQTQAKQLQELQGGGVSFLPVNSEESISEDEDSGK